jgi:Domain of unknown function (DUF4397)
MLFEPPHLVRQTARLASVAAILGVLSGCQAIISSPSLSEVRVITASPDAVPLDIYQGNNALTFNLSSGTITSYIPITPGTYTIHAEASGSRQVVSVAKATFAPSTQYTVLIGNSAANMQQLTLTDQSQPAPPGQISLRFIHQATRISAVDIYLVPAGQKLSAVTPLITGVAYGANTGYLNVPVGTYSLLLLPAGAVPISAGVATYAGAQFKYPSGAARTIILIDQQAVATPGLQVITANDFDSPAATE